MKKIIIFGATGNIGAYLVDYFLNFFDKGEYEVVAVGRKQTDFFKNRGIKYIRVDINNDTDFDLLPKEDVFAVVHLAGILPAYSSTDNKLKYVDVNIKGSIRILEYCKKVKADRILYTQTWSDLAGYWGKEETLKPYMMPKLIYSGDHAFYSITKCMIVDTIKNYYEECGLKYYIFRLPNIYMYSPVKTYFVDGKEKPIGYRFMIDMIKKGNNIEMWGNPYAYKDIIYIKDLCQMMALAVKCDVFNKIYNAGTGIKTTLNDQIMGMIKVFGKNKTINIIAKPEKPTFTSFVMDISNAIEELGYKPKFNYIEYLKDYKKEEEAQRFDNLWLNKE
ncbi:MAG: NAD(P)-dependent oxidoreductase [Clostridia bacterium]|nr:NAD(P)-dependent oxidoreductase [Clostridia bacterium]